jgi:hypothetical protein
MRTRLILFAAAGAMMLAGTAGGYAVGRIVTLRHGDTASFTNGWWCSYVRASAIHCIVGDQTPDVDLLSRSKGSLTVKVRATVGVTHVRRLRRHICAEPDRCWYEDTYNFSGGAGG